MSEVSNEELEAVYARIVAACDRARERCGGDEIEAMGSLSTELHDLIALRAALYDAQTQRTDAWENEDLAKARVETAERERDDARAEVETLRAEATLMREQLAAATAERDEARTEVMRLDDVLVERWQKDDRGLSLRAWMEMSEDTFAAWVVSGRAWPTVSRG